MRTTTRILSIAFLLLAFSAFSIAQQRHVESSDMPVLAKPGVAVSTLDIDPDAQALPVPSNGPEALWDIQFAYPLDTIIGSAGLAGSETNGTYLFAAHWGYNGTKHLFRLTMAGVLVDSILPAFLSSATSGIRDMAWDGYYLYGSITTTTIYCFDANGVLINTITSPVAVRAIAYDDVNDAFWVNNFSTTLTLVSRTGTTLNTITTPPSLYGCAYDNVTTGGPYLWIFTGTTSGAGCQIQQYVIATKTLTAVNKTVSGDFGTDAIAGGLWTHPNIVPGKYTLGGLAQSTLTLFGYEIGNTGAAPANDIGIAAIPEPVSGILGTAEQIKVSVMNYGTAAQSNFTVSYKVNTGTTVTETIAATVAGGASYQHTFTQTVDMSTPGGNYMIKAWTNLTGDADPSNDTLSKTITNWVTTTPWGIQLQYAAATITGGIGLAGAEWDGTHFYVAEWGSSGNRKVFKLNLNGTLAGQFTTTWVPGTSGLRDLAFDGMYLYGSDATNTIFCFDGNGNIINTITSPVAVRAIAYDEISDAFWVNNWDTDLTLVSRTGAILNVIPTPPSIYGLAYDNVTNGGPYLWLFSGTTSGGGCQVEQFKISTGTATGVTHSVSGDFGAGTDIAGGLFSASHLVPGTFTLGGLMQGAQILFGYFLDLITGNPEPVSFLDLQVFPNPATDVVFVRADQIIQNLKIYSNTGQLIKYLEVNKTSSSIDLSGFTKGIYFLRVESSQGTEIRKISLH